MHFDGRKVHTVADREQEVSMETGSTNIFLLENEAHAYAAATTTIFLATSLSFDVPLLPPPSLILSLFCSVALWAWGVRGFCICRERKRGDKGVFRVQERAASVTIVGVTF